MSSKIKINQTMVS